MCLWFLPAVLESCGRLVGRISAKFRVNPSSWDRVMNKKRVHKGGAFIYAQNLILVNLILVNFFSCFVITRNRSDIYGRNLVEIDPTSLPQLSKQLRDQKNRQKTEKIEIQNFEKIREKLVYQGTCPANLSSEMRKSLKKITNLRPNPTS